MSNPVAASRALLAERVAAVRRFNRFYTRRLGVLNEALLGSAFSLAEMRVLWELANNDGISATWLEEQLGLDSGCILGGFKERGFVKVQPASHDRRIRGLALTESGRRAFKLIDIRSHDEVRATLAKLTEPDRGRVTASMRNPVREQAWIAEREGERVGCVFVVQRSESVAQLRLLLVEPAARGRGIGSTLVSQCIRFARDARYRRMMLWTNRVLHAARHLYERSGFKRVKQEKHHSFGQHLVGQTFSLSLGRGPGRGSEHG